MIIAITAQRRPPKKIKKPNDPPPENEGGDYDDTTTDGPEVTTVSTNFTDANLVDTRVKQTLEDYHLWMVENMEEFKKDTREKFDSETGRIYEELEKDEFFNLYEGKCQADQLTTFGEYESDLDALIKVYMDHEMKRIDDIAMTSFNKFNTFFQDYVKASLITPLTTALRFNKVDKTVAISCANYYVPMIEEFIESTYTGALECYDLIVFYNETDVFQEMVNNLYRETASYFTTCTNNACFKRVKKSYLIIKVTKFGLFYRHVQGLIYLFFVLQKCQLTL